MYSKFASHQGKAFSLGCIRRPRLCAIFGEVQICSPRSGAHIHITADPCGDASVCHIDVIDVIAQLHIVRCADARFSCLRHLRHQRGNGGGEHHRHRREGGEQAGLHRYGRPAVAPMFHPHRFFPLCSVLPIRADRDTSLKFSWHCARLDAAVIPAAILRSHIPPLTD